MGNNRQSTPFRRDFLKLMGLGLGSALLRPAAHVLASSSSEDEVAILYDTSKCVGCRACEEACKECNNLPEEPEPPVDLSAITWNLIMQREGVELEDWPFFNFQCMHCTDAACVTVCPTGALYKDERGFIAFDEEKCNGCGYCTQFCPFGVPHLGGVNLITGRAKAGKCIFCCNNQPEQGLGHVACVEACPTGALTLDWRESQLEAARGRVSQLKADGYSKAMLYGETEAGGLHRLSVLLDEPQAYGLPSSPNAPVTLSKIWQNFLQPAGELAIGAAIVGILGTFFVVRRNIRMEEVK